MIISVNEAKELINFDDTWNDAKIERKLKAIEQVIRSYTNNNFQARAYRRTADIIGSLFVADALIPFEVGDTVQVSESGLNKGLYTIKAVEDSTFEVNESVKEESDVLVTKIVYPDDVIDCCINLLEWENTNRKKVGIKSETLSRHSVTYFDMDSNNQIMGYPASLLGCLKAYKKARC